MPIKDREAGMAKKQKGGGVYRIVDVVGVSKTSWEDAGKRAVETAANSLRDLRVAEVTKMDMTVEMRRIRLGARQQHGLAHHGVRDVDGGIADAEAHAQRRLEFRVDADGFLADNHHLLSVERDHPAVAPYFPRHCGGFFSTKAL